ncbi:L type [Durusdinium trenchii]|uniref:L type n=1 Tax=Durusdinium trenchii TaxID=1381693 RepID=A0ABP0Q2X6_9DINO
MQAWLVESMQASVGEDRSEVRREIVESQNASVQCDSVEVADASVQAASEKEPTRKKRRRPTRPTARTSRVSMVEVKDNRVAKRGVPVFADEREMKRNVRNAMMKTRYNVHELWCAQKIARHPYFENAVLAVIFLNAIWMSVDTDNNPAAVLVDAPPIFIVMENLFCLFFTTELLIRFVAFDRKRDCCRDFWFVFDCVINIYMIGETWILSLILLLSDMTTTEALFDASALRIIRMVKILRLSRMAKLLRAIPELSIVIKAIGAAGRSMLVIAVFCLMVVYVFALTLKQITLIVNTDPTDPSIAADFNSVLSAMNALLLRSLFSDSADLVNGLSNWHPVFWPCIMLFVLMTSVTMMYMLMGVMVNVIDIVAASEREGLAVSTVASSLRQVMKKLGISTDGPVSKEAVNDLLNEADVVHFLYSMDVDVLSLVEMIDQVFEDVLEREGRPLEFGDLVETIMNMRGSNPATVQDLKASIRALKMGWKAEMCHGRELCRNTGGVQLMMCF